jgi:lysophospholipase L1-like esterase
MSLHIRRDEHILFYGDSITDAGRDRSKGEHLGFGYAALAAARLQALYPELNLQFTNRGIGGNRIYDLEERLEADVLALKPTLVSILIGINDTWRRYDSNKPSPIAEFHASYRRILQQVAALGARIVILEPFVLPIPEDRRAWREDLDPRITAVRELTWEFNAAYLPLDGIFAQAATRQKMAYWLPDGVHPSAAGHSLIADHWIDLVTW